MKRKWLAFTLAFAMLVGCSSSPSNSSAEKSNASSTSSSAIGSGSSSGGTIEVDKKLLTVEFTIPANLLDGVTQDDIDKEVAEKGYLSGKLNDDGSATYTMKKSDHTKYMEEFKAQIDQALSDMSNSADTPNITSIEANKDYTEFKVKMSSNEVGMAEAFAALALYMYGGMYNALNGTPVDDVVVKYLDSTGNIIDEAHMADTAK